MKAIDPKASAASKKVSFDAIPISAMVNLAISCQSGADKYGQWNWLDLPDNSMSLMTYINAAQRHLLLFRAGQDDTSDTGVNNLDAIIAGLSVVRDAMLFGKVKDDRMKLTEDQIKKLESLINK